MFSALARLCLGNRPIRPQFAFPDRGGVCKWTLVCKRIRQFRGFMDSHAAGAYEVVSVVGRGRGDLSRALFICSTRFKLREGILRRVEGHTCVLSLRVPDSSALALRGQIPTVLLEACLGPWKFPYCSVPRFLSWLTRTLLSPLA